MKSVFIILLFPSVAFGFLEGVAYKKSSECNKVETALETDLRNIDIALRKYYFAYSKAFLGAQKHKCFRQTPTCKKAVSDAQKTATLYYKSVDEYEKAHIKIERMKWGVDIDPNKPYTEWDRYKRKNKRAELYGVKWTAKAYMDEARAYHSKATSEIDKYCKADKKLNLAKKGL